MKHIKKLIIAIALVLGMVGSAWGDISTGLVGYWPLNQNWMQKRNCRKNVRSKLLRNGKKELRENI